MVKNFVSCVAVMAALAGVVACKREQPPPGPDVWAVVNGREIRRDEVEKYYRSRSNPENQEPSQEEALSLKLSILDELINNEILLERAKTLNLEASDGEVEDKFTEFKAPYSEEEFQRQLKERAIGIDDLKKELRRQISIQKLINREVVSKISITDQDISDAYNQNRAQFNVTEPQYHIAQIVVTPRPNPQVRNRKKDKAATETDARRKVTMLLDRLKAGANFSDLAMDYSEDPTTASNGGDLGFIPESALNQSDPALKRVVLELKPGAVSGVIVQRDGYRILKMLGREKPGQRQLSEPEVRDTIRNTLRNRKEQLLRAAYLAILRDDAHATNYLARQILQSTGKLPGTTKSGSPAASMTPGSGASEEKQ